MTSAVRRMAVWRAGGRQRAGIALRTQDVRDCACVRAYLQGQGGMEGEGKSEEWRRHVVPVRDGISWYGMAWHVRQDRVQKCLSR